MVWYRCSALTLIVASKVRGAGLLGGPHALAVTALVRALNMREDFILGLNFPRNVEMIEDTGSIEGRLTVELIPVRVLWQNHTRPSFSTHLVPRLEAYGTEH